VSTLLLVRHGQASFFGGDYDRLSPRGEAQARRVGEYLARTGRRLDRAYVGPLLRHVQTAECAAAACVAAGGAWPVPERLVDLAEHHAPAVMKAVLGLDDASGDGGLKSRPAPDPDDSDRLIRAYFRRWRQVARGWIAGDYPDLPYESWQAARLRAARALAAMTADADRGEFRVAFSSGGLISMIVGEILGIDDDRTLDLSLSLANTGLTEIRFSGERRSLAGFNLLPHLERTDLASMV